MNCEKMRMKPQKPAYPQKTNKKYLGNAGISGIQPFICLNKKQSPLNKR